MIFSVVNIHRVLFEAGACKPPTTGGELPARSDGG